MKKLVKLDAVFNEETGLKLVTEEIPVLKENSKAVVLDTEDFKTVYKGKAEHTYIDYIDEPKVDNNPIGLGNIIGVKGYFSDEKKAEKKARAEVNKYLSNKVEYYNNLLILFDN